MVLLRRFEPLKICLNCFTAGQEIDQKESGLIWRALTGDAFLRVQTAGCGTNQVNFDREMRDFDKKNLCRGVVPG